MQSWRSPTPDRRPPPAWLTAGPYAHRGLHGPGIPENSLAAFRAAIAAGQGIELDVQACSGGHGVVFHDESLERLCGQAGRLATLTPGQLAGFRLLESDETISTLDDVLALIAGQVPVLIEIKSSSWSHGALCRSVASALTDYHGPAAVMSFSPAAIFWFRCHAAHLPRGLVMTEHQRKSPVLQHLAFRAVRPDFLAYDIRSLPSRFARRARASGIPILSWTIRDTEARDRARRHADQIIHELR
jgi:glycerophosphoryl diester phosphodiesterase